MPHVFSPANGNFITDLSFDKNNSPPFPFPEYPSSIDVSGTEGIYYKDGFLLCGGRLPNANYTMGTNRCHYLSLGSNMSMDFPPLLFNRTYASSASYKGKLWITGGRSGNHK